MTEENAEAGTITKVTTSERDRGKMRDDLVAWLHTTVGADSDPEITHFEAPESNGMSSETILFDAQWTENGLRSSHELVMRLAPDPNVFPVFEFYDLTQQFQAIALIAEHTSIPVPEVLWDEPGSDALGAPFFIMRRVHGVVPPDVMPYTFGDCWVTDASDEDRQRIESGTIEVLAKLREIPDPLDTFAVLANPRSDTSQSPLRQHVEANKRWLNWATNGVGSPLIDECFEWLEAHWPEEESEAVVSWGDARIGNVMYRDFEPVAVLDWEMAALAPSEIDLAWFIYLHRFFDDLAVDLGVPGLPDFIRRDRVEAAFAERTGHQPRDMDWYLMYAATRHGIVFTRVGRRLAHLGEGELPEDPDDLIIHGSTLRKMLDGTYWE